MSTRPGAWSALPDGWVLVTCEQLDDDTVVVWVAEAVGYTGACSCRAETVLARHAGALADIEVALCGCTGRAAQLLGPGASPEQIDAARDKLSARLAACTDGPEEIA